MLALTPRALTPAPSPTAVGEGRRSAGRAVPLRAALGYSGTLFFLLVLGLALANWASLVATIAAGLIGLLYRVGVEEQTLTEVLGQPYVDYTRRTKRFIPFVV